MIPDLDLARVRRWLDGCNAEIPGLARDRIRYDLDLSDRAITVVECRPVWNRGELGGGAGGGLATDRGDWARIAVCRFRYTKTRSQWSLYWPDSQERFHLYDEVEPTPHIELLLTVVSEDPTGVFWG